MIWLPYWESLQNTRDEMLPIEIQLHLENMGYSGFVLVGEVQLYVGLYTEELYSCRGPSATIFK